MDISHSNYIFLHAHMLFSYFTVKLQRYLNVRCQVRRVNVENPIILQLYNYLYIDKLLYFHFYLNI